MAEWYCELQFLQCWWVDERGCGSKSEFGLDLCVNLLGPCCLGQEYCRVCLYSYTRIPYQE